MHALVRLYCTAMPQLYLVQAGADLTDEDYIDGPRVVVRCLVALGARGSEPGSDRGRGRGSEPGRGGAGPEATGTGAGSALNPAVGRGHSRRGGRPPSTTAHRAE